MHQSKFVKSLNLLKSNQYKNVINKFVHSGKLFYGPKDMFTKFAQMKAKDPIPKIITQNEYNNNNPSKIQNKKFTPTNIEAIKKALTQNTTIIDTSKNLHKNVKDDAHKKV